MIIKTGPLPISAYDAYKRIGASFSVRGRELRPNIVQIGADVHVSLIGIVFNYWTSLDEEICLLNTSDVRTLEQKRDSRWLEYIDAQVFRNASDAEAWLAREVEKYSEMVLPKYH